MPSAKSALKAEVQKVLDQAIKDNSHKLSPFIVWQEATESWKPEETRAVWVPLPMLGFALGKMLQKHKELMICCSCNYKLLQERIDSIAIVQYVDGQPIKGWTSDIVGSGNDAAACAWEAQDDVVTLINTLKEMPMEKEGTPTALSKQVSFNLEKEEPVTKIEVTLKGGKPVNVAALGTESIKPDEVAKLLRQAANQLRAD